MEQKEMTVDILNDLVRINNDRVEGYKKAIDETNGLDIDLKSIFSNCIADSEQYKNELAGKIAELGGSVANGTTVSGQIYRAWMDVKATFSGSDRKTILASCEFGEDAAQKAYKTALEDLSSNENDIYNLISQQKESLKKAHDLIKLHRDAHSNL